MILFEDRKLQNNHFLFFPSSKCFINTERESELLHLKKQNIWSHIKAEFKVAPCFEFWSRSHFSIPGKSLGVLLECGIFKAVFLRKKVSCPNILTFKCPTFTSVYTPVCSAADLCGSTDRGERWQQQELTGNHSWPALPWSCSRFF